MSGAEVTNCGLRAKPADFDKVVCFGVGVQSSSIYVVFVMESISKINDAAEKEEVSSILTR